MKKILIPILMLLPLATLQAQSVLTPQQQLEEAQKKLEEAKKAVEEAKQAKLQAEKVAEEAKKAEEANRKAEAEKIQQQIKAAEAEAERLRNEAEKINAEASKAAEDAKVATSDVKTDKTANATETKAGGWTIPTAPAKTESKKEKTSVATTANGVKLKEDPKYLEGAVPTDENGKVEFVENIQAPGKSAAQLYNIVYGYMTQLTQDKNSIGNRIALVNRDKHVIANAMDEWIVFSSSFISLDRTEAKYNLIAEITDGNVKLTINHINYTYEEGRSTGFKSSAEDIITDKVALTKKKNDVARIFGKFRKKTIDRKDQIFSELKDLVK